MGHTLFKWTVTEPLASIVAVSPRREVTLPKIRTVWLAKESRYWALMRGVASETIMVLGDYRKHIEGSVSA